jgi:hypothetical protein
MHGRCKVNKTLFSRENDCALLDSVTVERSPDAPTRALCGRNRGYGTRAASALSGQRGFHLELTSSLSGSRGNIQMLYKVAHEGRVLSRQEDFSHVSLYITLTSGPTVECKLKSQLSVRISSCLHGTSNIVRSSTTTTLSNSSHTRSCCAS